MEEKGLIAISNVAIMMYKPLVFMYMFNWFVSSTFDLQEIGYFISFGITLTFGLLKGNAIDESAYHYRENHISDNDKKTYRLTRPIAMIVSISMIFGLAWVIQSFI